MKSQENKTDKKCGNCFLYHDRKKVCAIDGKYRMKVNGCEKDWQPKVNPCSND